MLSRRSVINMMVGYAVAAFVVTSVRLAIRKVRNWGKDDALAAFATLGLMAQATLMSLKDRGYDIANGTAEKNANVYYVNNFLFYTQDWAARLSILFSILRICPTPRMSVFLKATAVLFVLTWITLVSLLIGYCKKDEAIWSNRKPLAVCQLNKSVIYLQFAVGILSDLVLIIVPFRILRLLPNLKSLVFRLRILFSATFLLTAATTIQTAITLSAAGRAGTSGLIAATTETFVAILVCNATALASAIVFLFSKEQPAHEGVSTLPVDGSSKDGDSTNSEKAGHTMTQTTATHTTSFTERWKQMDIDADLERELQSAAPATNKV